MTQNLVAKVRRIERFVDGYAVITNILGVAAVIGAITSPNTSFPRIMLWLTVSIVVIVPMRAAVLRQIGPDAPPLLVMGGSSMPRVNVLLASLILMGEEGSPLPAAIVAALLGLLVIGEQAMRRPVKSAAPTVANVPHWEIPQPSILIGNLLFVANTLGMVLLAVAEQAELALGLAAVCAAGGVLLGGLLAAQVIRYLVHRGRFEENLPRILDELAPAFTFHWQAPAGTAYQAAMWLPYLARLGKPYFILVRTPANFYEVAKLTDAPIILRAGLEDLDSIVCPSLKAVFYANTAVRNSHMIRFPNLSHIQLNHGDSDKIASVSPTFRQYDRNFVAGQAAIDRFAKHGVETRSDQFVIVGRPQLEDVQIATAPVSAFDPPTVLYCPTWSGFYEDSDYSSLPAGKVIVRALLERGCTVVFRPHPYARKHRANALACTEIIETLALAVKQTGVQHVYGQQAESAWSILDCMNASNAMITDVSSVASDYLYSGKPFAMAAASVPVNQFREQFPLADAAYVFGVARDGSITGLDDALADMLGADPMSEKRLALRAYYLSDTPPARYAQRFIDEARRFIM